MTPAEIAARLTPAQRRALLWRVTLWRWLAATLSPLYLLGIPRPYAWAHVKWLEAHCSAVRAVLEREKGDG